MTDALRNQNWSCCIHHEDQIPQNMVQPLNGNIYWWQMHNPLHFIRSVYILYLHEERVAKYMLGSLQYVIYSSSFGILRSSYPIPILFYFYGVLTKAQAVANLNYASNSQQPYIITNTANISFTQLFHFFNPLLYQTWCNVVLI